MAFINAVTANYTDVNNALSSASNGDTINLPAGNVTWSNGFSTTKALSFIGAGTGSGGTRINNAFGTLGKFSNLGANLGRISNIRIDSVDSTVVVFSMIGPIDGFRVDHCYFNKGDCAVAGNFYNEAGTGHCYGVIDHCTFVNMSRPHFSTDKRSGDSPNWGTAAWTEAIEPGTYKMIFVEDCKFIWDSNLTNLNAQGAIYGQYGGKCCFRYNTLTGFGVYVDAHGDNPDYGTMLYEMYGNNFTEGSSGGVIQGFLCWQRGGTWIVHDNVFNSSVLPMKVSMYWTSDVHVPTGSYIYNNTLNGSTTDQSNVYQVGDSGQTPDGWSFSHVIKDRDFFFHAPQSGQRFYPYSTYTYPHPLVGGGSPGVIQFANAAQTVNEASGSLTINVSRSSGTSGSISCSYSSSAVTATAAINYTELSGAVSWMDGDASNKTFSLSVIDTAMTSSKTVKLFLYNPTNGAITGSTNQELITINGSATTGSGGSSNRSLQQSANDAVSVTSPFTLGNDTGLPFIYSPSDTILPTSTGVARWNFDVLTASYYYVQLNANIADSSENSIYIDIDNNSFLEPSMVWDSQYPISWTQITSSWRGAGIARDAIDPKIWFLSQGTHTLYIGSREAGFGISSVTMSQYAYPFSQAHVSVQTDPLNVSGIPFRLQNSTSGLSCKITG